MDCTHQCLHSFPPIHLPVLQVQLEHGNGQCERTVGPWFARRGIPPCCAPRLLREGNSCCFQARFHLGHLISCRKAMSPQSRPVSWVQLIQWMLHAKNGRLDSRWIEQFSGCLSPSMIFQRSPLPQFNRQVLCNLVLLHFLGKVDF